MTKLLYVGDLHIRGTTPRNRLDDYPAALKAKIAEINALAVQHDVDAILCAGDIFDRPEVSINVLLGAFEDFRVSEKPWYTTAGNHDLYGYNLATYHRTSLHLLEMLLPNFHVINDPSQPLLLGNRDDWETSVQVTFTPFSGKMDVDGYGYSPEVITGTRYKIHVSHGMLLDHDPPFDSHFTRVQTVKTEADLVLCGHDHTGFGIYRRSDGKVFVNCGSVTRLSASQTEIERPIQVLLIDFVSPDVAHTGRWEAQLSLLPLESAKPGLEVLDRSKIEAETKRQYAMEEFAALVQRNTGEKVLMNVPDIIAAIADQEQFAPEVVEKALEKINEQRAVGLK